VKPPGIPGAIEQYQIGFLIVSNDLDVRNPVGRVFIGRSRKNHPDMLPTNALGKIFQRIIHHINAKFAGDLITCMGAAGQYAKSDSDIQKPT
jgi:hypothetical protein